jgi:hypothetical protein
MGEILVVTKVSGKLRYGKVVSNLLCPFTWQAGDIDSDITDSDMKFFCHLRCISIAMVYICEELGGGMYGWANSRGTVGERMADSEYAKFGNGEQQPLTGMGRTQIR